MHFADIYLIFNGYYNYSIKSNIKEARVKIITHSYNLLCQSPFPSKNNNLSCTKSKVQLIQQMSVGLVDICLIEKNRLVITSKDHCPT